MPQRICIQLKAPSPSRNFYGEVAYHYHDVKDGIVTLTDESGKPLSDAGLQYSHQLRAGENPRTRAVLLTRLRRRMSCRGVSVGRLLTRRIGPASYEAVHYLAHPQKRMGQLLLVRGHGILTVVAADGRKTARLGGLQPEILAQVLMRELVINNRTLPNRSQDRSEGNGGVLHREGAQQSRRGLAATALPCPPYVPLNGIVRVVEPVTGIRFGPTTQA